MGDIYIWQKKETPVQQRYKKLRVNHEEENNLKNGSVGEPALLKQIRLL